MTTFLGYAGYFILCVVMVCAVGAGWLLTGVGGVTLGETPHTAASEQEASRLICLGVGCLFAGIVLAFVLGASL